MKNSDIMNINEKSIFYKIKRFFLNLKKGINKDINNDYTNNTINNDVKFTDAIKTDIIPEKKDEINKDVFVKNLTGDVESLKLLSIDRLEKIIEYNQNVINANEEKIQKLKKQN